MKRINKRHLKICNSKSHSNIWSIKMTQKQDILFLHQKKKILILLGSIHCVSIILTSFPNSSQIHPHLPTHPSSCIIFHFKSKYAPQILGGRISPGMQPTYQRSRQPTRGHALKENLLSLLQQLYIFKIFSAKGGTLCPSL